MINTETDYTGLSPDHTIVDERLNVTSVNINHHNFVIPRYAPFYVKRRDGETLTLIHEDSGKILYEGADFQFTNKHLELSHYLQKELYGSITFRDRSLSGIVRIPEYQTIGFPWTLDETAIASQLANIAENPRTASFEQVFGMPAGVPPLKHSVNLEDLKGMEEIVAAILSVKESIDTKVLDFNTYFNDIKTDIIGEDRVHQFRNLTKIGKFLETFPLHSELNEERLLAMSRSEDIAYKFANQPYLDFRYVEESNMLADYTQGVYPVSCDVSGSNIVVGCTLGYVIVSNDKGLTWETKRLDIDIQQETITAVAMDGNYVVIGSSMGKIRYSLDAGASWLKSNNDIGQRINAIRYCDMNLKMWILIGEGGEVRRSTNYGLTWSADYAFADYTNPKCIDCEPNSVIFVGTDGGDIYRSTDGIQFSKIHEAMEDSIKSLTFSGGYLLIGHDGGRIGLSKDSGNTFTYQNSDVQEITASTGLVDGRAVVVGVNVVDDIELTYKDRRRNDVRGLTLVRTLDKGVDWSLTDAGVINPQLLDVASDGDIWVAVGHTKTESVISVSRVGI